MLVHCEQSPYAIQSLCSLFTLLFCSPSYIFIDSPPRPFQRPLNEPELTGFSSFSSNFSFVTMTSIVTISLDEKYRTRSVRLNRIVKNRSFSPNIKIKVVKNRLSRNKMVKNHEFFIRNFFECTEQLWKIQT